MAVTTTTLGFKKPDGNELFKLGDNAISDNAQKAEDVLQGVLGRLGQAEADIDAGNGSGSGLTADPMNPGLYFRADVSPLTADPANPGLYTL